MKNKSIFIYVFILFAFSILASIYFLGQINTQTLLEKKADDITVFSSAYFRTFESQDTKALSATLDSILQDPGFKKIFLSQNRDELNEYGQPLFQKLKDGYGITHFYFMLPDGTTFLRLHNSKIFGDLNNRITFNQAVESKDIGFGLELGKTAFALRVVKPYFDNNKLIGYIELGQEIDHFLSVLKDETNNEYAIFVQKNKLSQIDWEAMRQNAGQENNWDKFSEMILVNSTIDMEKDENIKYANCFNEINANNFFTNPGDKFVLDLKNKISCSGFPLIDASGSSAGMVLVNYDLSSSFVSINHYIKILQIIVVILILITLLVSIFFSRKSFSVEKKYQYLFENSMDAIIMLIKSPDWKFSDGNKMALNLFGLKDVKELQASTLSDLSPEYQPDKKLSGEKSKEMINLAIKNGSNFFEWTHKKIDGTEFIAEISLSKINNLNMLQMVVRDITEQKKYTDLIKQSEGKALKALEEAQHINKLMVGRELEMIKLKKEILDLKDKS